jgi:RHH-type proline utilization regulon transcriptional repressor/proline dehydrogenase/delta 1-pyrroline-5-carboxylate dehydrogenase
MTIDAEEADRLELSLDVIGAVFAHPSLAGWNGFGMAVQAYQKRAPFVIDYMADRHASTSGAGGTPGQGRLLGLRGQARAGTRARPATRCSPASRTPICPTSPALDACSKSEATFIYPMFATHNAHTIAAVHHYGAHGRPYEYQKLHGMGTTCMPK